MAITVNIYYTGENGNARLFAQEMLSSGVVDLIKAEDGNLRYDYFLPLGDENTVLLIDSWKNQQALDVHHNSPVMNRIIELRNKYNLTMKVERYVSDVDGIPEKDKKFIQEK